MLKRHSVLMLLVVSFLFLAYFALRMGNSDYYLRQAIETYTAENNTGALPNSSRLNSALSTIDQSLSWQSSNAKALDYKGYLLSQRWLFQPDSPFFSKSSILQSAEALHNKALVYREDWPYSYISLMELYSHEQALAANFYTAFDGAYETGKYERATALALMKMGALKWQELPEQYKNRTIELSHLSLMQKSNNPNELAVILKRQGLLVEVCSAMPESSRKPRMCG
jgi:hypothetical protein